MLKQIKNKIIHNISIVKSNLKDNKHNPSKYIFIKDKDTSKHTLFKPFTKRILILTLRIWFPVVSKDDIHLIVTEFFKKVDIITKHNGPKAAITYIKVSRLVLTRYICGQKLLSVKERIPITKDGFPKLFLSVRELVDSGDITKLRFVMTLASISRTIEWKGKPDYSSITSKYTGELKNFSPLDKEFMKVFVKDYNLFINKERFDFAKHYFLNLKAGPLGQGIRSANIHIAKWIGQQHAALQQLTDTYSIMKWKECYLKYLNKYNQEGKDLLKSPIRNRKLSLVHDPEGKVRVIAIYDYITQCVLDIYSKQMFSALKHFTQDRTYTQDPHIVKTDLSSKFYSYDLKSATDRFPIWVQRALLTEMTDSVIGHAWKSIMTTEPFMTPEGNLISYEVGQPMGARSSWAMFTISHHFIVALAAFKCGKYPFTNYILLGDDIVINDDRVAEEYKLIMSGLGVEISDSKSHVSNDTYEFAKRWFKNGQEFSGIPLNGFLNALDTPIELYSEILNIYYTRKYIASDLSDTLAVLKRFVESMKYSPTNVRYILHICESFRLAFRNNREFDYELTRKVFGSATKNIDYILTPNRLGLEQEYSRVGSVVVNMMILEILNTIGKYLEKLIGNFHAINYLDPHLSLTKEEVSDFPVWNSLLNAVLSLEKVNQNLGKTKDLFMSLQDLALVDIELLSKNKRASVNQVYMMNKFSIKLFRQLMDEPYYHSGIKVNETRIRRAFFDITLYLKQKFKGVEGAPVEPSK